MGVKTLNIDVKTTFNGIKNLISTYNVGNPDYDYVEDCFHVYHDNACQVIRVEDDTLYQDLTRIIINGNPPVTFFNASLWRMHKCAPDELVVSESQHVAGETWQYDNLKPGCYEVRIRAQYTLTTRNQGQNVIVNKNITLKIDLNCCKDTKEHLIEKIRQKIASVSCKIKDYGHIGRDFTKLTKTQYKLQAILWALLNCKECCDDVDLYKCKVDKIVVDCGC